MNKVPHVSFRVALSSDAEFKHPPGASLARALEGRLRALSGTVQPFDNWRDCGWFVVVQLNHKSFEVYFALFQPDRNEWLLAIAPLHQPGFVKRLLGHKPFECSAELKSISQEIHSLLVAMSDISDVRWFFGGPPGKVPSTDSPEQLPWPIAP
jgi:hypothetical protein